MVQSILNPEERARRRRVFFCPAAILALWWLGAAAELPARQPDAHYLHHGVMPPGAIGARQLRRGGPLPGFYQPVEIKAPRGVLVSLAVENRFDRPTPAPRNAGMLIGAVYRLRVTDIPLAEGMEVFPTIEVIDRTYAPPGQERRFPIPVVLTEEDLKLALAGKFVTRVIFLEDNRRALPADAAEQNWFEAAPGQDPLAVADGLGRPVAILRLGARLPDEEHNPFFFFGSPPFIPFSAAPKVSLLPPPPGTPKGGKGGGYILCEAPFGPSRQNVPVPFSSPEKPEPGP